MLGTLELFCWGVYHSNIMIEECLTTLLQLHGMNPHLLISQTQLQPLLERAKSPHVAPPYITILPGHRLPHPSGHPHRCHFGTGAPLAVENQGSFDSRWCELYELLGISRVVYGEN